MRTESWKKTLLVAALGSAGTAYAQTTLFEYDSNATNQLIGQAVTAIDDVDQDGIHDFVFGFLDSTTGSAFIALRVASGANGSILRTIQVGSPTNYISRALVNVGDIDGDGFTEIAVGSAGDFIAPDGKGAYYVCSPKTGVVLQQVFGLTLQDHLGRELAAAGDLDLDGVPDIVAAKLYLTKGVRVYSGADGTVLTTLLATGPGAIIVESVDSASDLDLDGYPDFVLGTPEFDGAFPLADAGAVQFRSGVDGAEIGKFVGLGSGVELGSSVLRIGDTTGDGVADFAAISDQIPGPPLEWVYRLRVLDGANFTQTAQLDKLNASPWTLDLQRCGDVDGDGRADLLVGSGSISAPWQPLAGVGSARVLSGTDLRRIDLMFAPAGEKNFGAAVASLGDLNQDGAPEFAVGNGATSTLTGAATKLRVLSRCTPKSVVYGSACHPLGGPLPALSVTGCFEPSGQLTVLADGIASPVMYFASLAAASLPLPGGCPLLVDPSSALLVVATNVVAGQSGFEVAVPPALAGVTIAMQAIGSVPSGANIIAITTNGVLIPLR